MDEHNDNGNYNIHDVLVQVEGDTAQMEDANDSEEYEEETYGKYFSR